MEDLQENRSRIGKPPGFHGPKMGGKNGADMGISRRPLRDINNFMGAVKPQRNFLNDKSSSNCLSLRLLAEPGITADHRTHPRDLVINEARVGKEETVASTSGYEHLPNESTFEMDNRMEEMVKDVLDEDERDDVVNFDRDIDFQHANDPLAVVEYVQDIYAFFQRIECTSCVSPNYMSKQIDINEKMRAILIDWLIEMHYKFDLMEETLFLMVNIIDRFLARQMVLRKQLQLVGITAFFLACKYEEVTVPLLRELVIISDQAFTRAEILEMERQVVNVLEFDMSTPTPYVFLRRCLKAAASDRQLELLSLFMVELCLVEYEMLKFPPSLLAAAAVYTALCSAHGFKVWSRTCELCSTYSELELLECARKMVGFHLKAPLCKQATVFKKYSTLKYGYAASSPPAKFLLQSRKGPL